jgi:uncharacterized membrane protein YfcA
LSIETILILFCIGIAAGILSGLFGVGGGIIIVPSLLMVYALNHFDSPYIVHIAIATSLFTIIFTSISSSHKHFSHGNVEWKAALYIGAASAITVFLFSRIAILLPGEILKKIFSIVLLVVALKMLLDKKKKNEVPEDDKPEELNKWICLGIGGLSGAIAAFSGLGGGVFVIPLMHYLMKVPIKKAIGTSSAAILITAIAGVLSYFINSPAGSVSIPYSFGMVDTIAALPVIAASIPFARVGVFINKKIHHFILTKLFAVFIIIVSLKLIFF